jgi:hypothetical protein
MGGDRVLGAVGAVALAGTMLAGGALEGTGHLRDEHIGVTVILGLAGLAAFLLAPAGRRVLLARPVLLGPLALHAAFQGAVSLLVAHSPLSGALVAGPDLPFLRLSGAFLLRCGAAVLYASWATLLVLRAAGGEPASPVAEFPEAVRRFPRVLALCFTGWAALLVPLGLLGPVLPMALLVPLILGGTLWWNFFTAGLLPFGIDPGVRFGEALGRGTLLSWARRRLWWKPLLAQMVLLGIFVLAEGTAWNAEGYLLTTKWSVNALWTGGYAAESRWLDGFEAVLGAAFPSAAVLALALLLGALALAVKVEVARGMRGAGDPGGVIPPSSEAGRARP